MADTPNTDHALQLAMFMQRRDAMQFGVVKDGEVTPTWEDSGLAQHEYIADAEVMLQAVGLLGYGPLAEVQAERDAALAVIEQAKAIEPFTVCMRADGSDNGETWVQQDELLAVLSQSPASALAKVKADARREALEEAATIAESVTKGWHPNQSIPIAVSRNTALLIRRAAQAEADRIEKEATGD